MASLQQPMQTAGVRRTFSQMQSAAAQAAAPQKASLAHVTGEDEDETLNVWEQVT
jgi:hypothetical protein